MVVWVGDVRAGSLRDEPTCATHGWWGLSKVLRETVPDDAGAQLAELLGEVATVEHVEHILQQLA
jgi:hypothetical protein